MNLFQEIWIRAHDGIATHSIPDRAGYYACLLACGYVASDGLHARKCRATFSGLARRELREARSPSYSRASGVTLCSRHHKVPRIAEHELGQTHMHRTPRYPASDKVTPALCIFCTIRVTSSGVELLQQNAVQNGISDGVPRVS